MPDLLYEIGAEEIPAGYIPPALDQLERALARELDAARLTHDVNILSAATPRRLTVAVKDVIKRQPDAEEEVLGPSAKVAFAPDGTPTKAVIGFARSVGVEVSAIARKQTSRGEYCCVQRKLKGRPALEVLAEILPRITLEISFPKSMAWLPERKTFARPVRALVALLGEEIVPFTLFGVASGRSTESHPILRPGRFDLPDADFDRYAALLREHQVIVEFPERQKMIRAEIERALCPFGGKFREEALLNEVTNLVQYPMVLVGHFDPAFLSVPAPVVEAAMMEHQRYFPMRDAAGKLQPHFIVVSDRPPEHAELIRTGNEQVLKARLSDARFFDEQDLKHRLEERVEALRGVGFLKGRGTYYDKTQRLKSIVESLSGDFSLSEQEKKYAIRAAQLCKADLLTEMVGEFPILQGKVGRIYAEREGEPMEVAVAIEEHYLPRSANGELPVTPVGKLLSAADKIDNLTSCFMLGLVPTGSQDPYALRRQAQGLLRIMEELRNDLDFWTWFSPHNLKFFGIPEDKIEQMTMPLRFFMADRLEAMASERNKPYDLVRAVSYKPRVDVASGVAHLRHSASREPICVKEFWRRLAALESLSNDKECWSTLVAAVERTYNISKPIWEDPPEDVQEKLLEDGAERTLWECFKKHRGEVKKYADDHQYEKAAKLYAEAFAVPLHDFFDKVFVNVDNPEVRRNRLLMMREINKLFSARIADLSQIVTGVQK